MNRPESFIESHFFKVTLPFEFPAQFSYTLLLFGLGLIIANWHDKLANIKWKGAAMEAILDKFGRIVIPKKIREDFNLRPGSSIWIEEGKGEIVLKPIEGEPSLIEKDGVLVFTGKSLENLETKIEELRGQRNQSLGGFK